MRVCNVFVILISAPFCRQWHRADDIAHVVGAHLSSENAKRIRDIDNRRPRNGKHRKTANAKHNERMI